MEIRSSVKYSHRILRYFLIEHFAGVVVHRNHSVKRTGAYASSAAGAFILIYDSLFIDYGNGVMGAVFLTCAASYAFLFPYSGAA